METHASAIASFPKRNEESVTDAAPRALTVTAVYHLSEMGRKVSLLEGGDGRAIQQLTLSVPEGRLHLVTVDAEGVAVLKLRPQYRIREDQTVVRTDAPPVYDRPPTVEQLFRDAARNHQLEQMSVAERTQQRGKVAENRQQLAERFLATPEMRAVEYPPPTERRCLLRSNGNLIAFDAKTDKDAARQVPPEAFRRFRQDVRARAERKAAIRARDVALFEERQQVIADWVARRGTPDQRARHAAGVLPVKEVVDGLADETFAVVGDRLQYVHDGPERMQRLLRTMPAYAGVVVHKDDLLITTAIADFLTEAHWALKQALERALPDAKMFMRVHRIALKNHPEAGTITQLGVLVVKEVGPFKVKREYVVVDSQTQQDAG